MGERLTDEELQQIQRAPGHWFASREYNDMLVRLLTEVRERRAAAEETEMAMHARIRHEYDSTIADCWRVVVAKKDARIATLEAALRECIPCIDDGPYALDIEQGIVERARAALRGGG